MGPLQPTYLGTQPYSRTSYVAAYFDGVGRPVATANYGTNNDEQFIWQDTVPVPSDTVLVTSLAYGRGKGDEEKVSGTYS